MTPTLLTHMVQMAEDRGAPITRVPGKGHLSQNSDLGAWTEGRQLLNDFLAQQLDSTAHFEMNPGQMAVV
jgi:predicted alpha/beta hydrolase family esterase